MINDHPRLRAIITRRAVPRALLWITVALGLAVAAAAGPAAAAPTGEVTIGLAAEPNTFDPHLTVGRNTQIFIVNVYDGLTARDAQGNLVPALATSWKRLNPTTWQFTLRKGVKFHNGDEFNADAVKFTLDRAINPETKATVSSELSTIARTEIVDPFTVNVITKAPDFLLPVRLGELYGLMLSPKHTSATGKEGIATRPTGTGPVAAPRIFHVTIDVRKPPFDNVKVRQALNHAVDANAIVKSLYFGYGTRLATVVDKGALGYDPKVPPYPYDPAKAKALLAEAGFPNGFETEFDSFTGSIADHAKPAEAIAGYLQKVGLKLKHNVFEFGAFGPRRVNNQTAPLFIYSIGNAYLEPSWVIRWLTQGGLGMHYKNAKLDEMLTRIEATDDPRKRAEQYSDVQKLLRAEAPFIFLFQADAVFGMSTRIDYTPRPDETQWLYPLGLKK
jgi:ABC-type transport system substrate-binding protein